MRERPDLLARASSGICHDDLGDDHFDGSSRQLKMQARRLGEMQVDMTGANDERSLVDRITDVLAKRIVTGRLPAGAPVRQDHVATEFNASHVPVREAFRRLEARGLVRSEPRRGVRVTAMDSASILELSEMRAVLEVMALRHAMQKLTKDDLCAAETALVMGEASDELEAWDIANRQFHRALVTPCGMPRLLATIDDLHEAGARFLYATWQIFERQSATDAIEHRAVLAAVRSGNQEEACILLHTHIMTAGQALARYVAPIRVP